MPLRALIHFTLVLLILKVATVTATAADLKVKQEKAGALHEIRIGLLAHDVGGLWSGFNRESGVDLNAELIFNKPSFFFLYGIVRPNFGVTINSQGDTSTVYAGLLWERGITSNIFLNLGLGAAAHNGEIDPSQTDKKALGSRILFRIPIELSYRFNKRHRISLLFAHMSNGYLASPNEGLDNLGLRYGFGF